MTSSTDSNITVKLDNLIQCVLVIVDAVITKVNIEYNKMNANPF